MLLAGITLTALTACAQSAEPPASSIIASDAPQVTTPVGTEVPAEFVAAANESFPEWDPATVYESAQFYCLTLTNIDGDQQEAAWLLQNEVGLTAGQTQNFMPLAIEFVCPEWRDEYDAWVISGGPDHL
jgi:hypothetical protein